MYARIVAALDGSPAAEQVLPHVEALAERFGSTVTLVQVQAPLEQTVAATAVVESAAVVDPTALLEEERQDAAAYLGAVAGRLRDRGLVVGCEQPEGNAADEIVAYARASGAHLIAMTTHGRGGLGRLVFGSVADRVLRHAPCPVLLVRVEEPGEDEPDT